MKALSTTILIVVSAVVVLIVALVVLTIFGKGIDQTQIFTNFKSGCMIQCAISCRMSAMPPTWSTEVNVQGLGKTSCEAATGVKGCEGCGGTAQTATCTSHSGQCTLSDSASTTCNCVTEGTGPAASCKCLPK